jgi:hypothetical protein
MKPTLKTAKKKKGWKGREGRGLRKELKRKGEYDQSTLYMYGKSTMKSFTFYN